MSNYFLYSLQRRRDINIGSLTNDLNFPYLFCDASEELKRQQQQQSELTSEIHNVVRFLEFQCFHGRELLLLLLIWTWFLVRLKVKHFFFFFSTVFHFWQKKNIKYFAAFAFPVQTQKSMKFTHAQWDRPQSHFTLTALDSHKTYKKKELS